MVYVRLERDWTDGEGTSHPSGTTVDVDAGTLAELQAEGIVADPEGEAGSEASGPGATPATWAGPTGAGAGAEAGAGTDTWAGPTGGSGGSPSGGAGSSGGAGTDTWAGPTGGSGG